MTERNPKPLGEPDPLAGDFCDGEDQRPGPQPHPSDEPPIPDAEDLPGTPRPAQPNGA